MSLPAKGQPFFIGLLITATVAFFVLLVGFWQPIFWAAVIGIIFRPVEVWFAVLLGGRRSLAAVLTVILIFFTVLVPALSLAAAVAAEAVDIYTRIESGELGPMAQVPSETRSPREATRPILWIGPHHCLQNWLW